MATKMFIQTQSSWRSDKHKKYKPSNRFDGPPTCPPNPDGFPDDFFAQPSPQPPPHPPPRPMQPTPPMAPIPPQQAPFPVPVFDYPPFATPPPTMRMPGPPYPPYMPPPPHPHTSLFPPGPGPGPPIPSLAITPASTDDVPATESLLHGSESVVLLLAAQEAGMSAEQFADLAMAADIASLKPLREEWCGARAGAIVYVLAFAMRRSAETVLEELGFVRYGEEKESGVRDQREHYNERDRRTDEEGKKNASESEDTQCPFTLWWTMRPADAEDEREARRFAGEAERERFLSRFNRMGGLGAVY